MQTQLRVERVETSGKSDREVYEKVVGAAESFGLEKTGRQDEETGGD